MWDEEGGGMESSSGRPREGYHWQLWPENCLDGVEINWLQLKCFLEFSLRRWKRVEKSMWDAGDKRKDVGMASAFWPQLPWAFLPCFSVSSKEQWPPSGSPDLSSLHLTSRFCFKVLPVTQPEKKSWLENKRSWIWVREWKVTCSTCTVASRLFFFSKTVSSRWFITQQIHNWSESKENESLKHKTRSYMILRILFSESKNYKTEQRGKILRIYLVFHPLKSLILNIIALSLCSQN